MFCRFSMDKSKNVLLLCVFFVQILAKELSGGGKSAIWQNLLLDSELHQVERVRGSAKVQKFPADTSDTLKWYLLDSNVPLIAGVGSHIISLVAPNVPLSNYLCNYTITASSTPGNTNSESSLVVASQDEDGSHHLISFRHKDFKLVEITKEKISYLVERLAVWKNHVIVTSSNKLKLAENSHGRMLFRDGIELEADIADLATAKHQGGILAIVTIPSLQKIVAFHIKYGSSEIRHFSTINSERAETITLLQVGSNTMLGIGGQDSKILRLRPDGTFAVAAKNYGAVKSWLAVPLAGYQRQILLLGKRSSDIVVLENDGYYGFREIGNFDVFCLKEEDWCSEVDPDLIHVAAAGPDALLLPAKNREIFFINLKYQWSSNNDFFDLVVTELNGLHDQIEGIMEKQNKKALNLIALEKNASDMEGKHIVTAQWQVENMHIQNGDFLEDSLQGEFETEDWSFAGRDDWSEGDMELDLEDFYKEVETLKKDIENTRQSLQELLTSDTDEVTNYLPSLVSDGFASGHVKARNIHLQRINGQEASVWAADCFRLNHPRSLQGVKTVKSVEVSDTFFESLGNVPAVDLAYANANLHIRGNIVVNGEVSITGSIILPPDGTVNGGNLFRDLLRIDSDYSGGPVLESVVVRDRAQIGLMSASDDEPGIIMPVHFSPQDVDSAILHPQVEDVIVRNNLFVTNINGVPAEDILENFAQSIKEATFESLEIEKLNGIPFPSGFVRTSANSISLYGQQNLSHLEISELKTDLKSFLGDPLTEDNIFEGNNSFKFNAPEEKINEEMPSSEGKKIIYIFDNLEVEAPVRTKTLNNVTLKDLASTSKKPGNFSSRPVKRCSGGSRIDASKLWVDSINAKVVEVRGSITTEEDTSGLRLASLNYLSKRKPQVIRGNIFWEKLTVENLTIHEPLTALVSSSGIDFESQLEFKKIVLNGPLLAPLRFSSEVKIDELSIEGNFSGVNFTAMFRDSVLKTDKNVFVRGSKDFRNNLSIDIASVYQINEHKPSAIATLTGNQTFKSPVSFKSSVHIRGDLHSLGLINDVNITALVSKVSPDFGAFLVLGDLEVTKDLTVRNLVVEDTLQGIYLKEFFENALLKTDDIDLSSFNITFNDSVNFDGSLDISGNLNELNLSSFLDDIVLAYRPATLQSLVLNRAMFTDLRVESLSCLSINSWDVEKWVEDAIYLNKDVLEPFPVRFSNVSILKDLSVGVINGQSVDSVIPLRSNQIIPVKLLANEIKSSNHIDVGSSVNQRYLPDLWEDTLLQNSSQTISGLIRFVSDIVVVGDVETNALGNLPIRDFVTLDSEQNMTGLTVKGSVLAKKDVHTTGNVGGVDITSWADRVVMIGQKNNVTGSWAVKGEVSSVSGVDGSGKVLQKNIEEFEIAVESKLNVTQFINEQMSEDFTNQCKIVEKLVKETNKQLRILNKFEDIQGLEFHRSIQSVIEYVYEEIHYIIVTFNGICSARVYVWSQIDGKFIKHGRARIGSVDVWITVDTPHGFYLVTSGRSCHRNASAAVWKIEASELVEVQRFQPVSDVINDNTTSGKFYTVSLNGDVITWFLSSGLLLRERQVSLPPGKYKFVSLSLGLGLGVWNGERIVPVDKDSIITHRIPAAFSAFGPSRLVAVSDGLSRVELYRGNDFKHALDVLHYTEPSGLHWIDLNAPGEVYLLFSSDHNRIHVFQYKGVAGLVGKSVLAYPSTQILLMDLVASDNLRSPHILVVNDKTLHLLQVRIHGRPILSLNIQC